MARKLEVEILANVTGYTKGLVKAGEQTKAFAGTVDESTKHIGRSLALMTGGFVAFAGATEFLSASVNAARTAGVAQRQLAAQMKASGQSFTDSQAAIDKAGLSLEKFGFTSVDSAQALTVLERGTGKISEAIRLQGVAADLARAKNIGLSDAANVLAKVFGGQETALRRAVPGLDKQAHGLDLITEAQQRLAGQAAAGTTVAERFSATLHDTEIIIGNALLPTINHLLTSLGNWLTKMNESGKLQKDVNSAVQTGTALFQGLEAIVKPLAAAFTTLGDAVGGTKKEVELLALAFAGWKVSGWLNSIGLLKGGITGIGTSAETSEGQVRSLKGSLAGLGEAAAVAIAIGGVASELQKKQSLSSIGATPVLGGTLMGHKVGDPAFYEPALKQTGTLQKIGGQVFFVPSPTTSSGAAKLPASAIYGPPAPAVVGRVSVPGSIGGSIATTNRTLTPEQQLQIALAADPTNVGLLQKQAAYDRSSIGFLHRLHASGKGPGSKDLTQELTGFYNDLTGTLSTIASIQTDAASKAADAAAKSAAANKKAVDAAKARAEAGRKLVARLIGRQRESPEQYVAAAERPGSFERLGPLMVTSYGESLSTQLALAREQATGSSTTGTLQKARAAARKALRSGKLSLQAQIEAWNEIASLNDQLASSAKSAKTATDVTRRHQAQLPRAFALAGGGGITINGGLHLHGVQDVANLENELEARAKRRPQPRRGR